MKIGIICLFILILYIVYNCMTDDTHENFESKKSVIVIGAGIAGLTTAQLLIDKGFDVVILEARDRIGGRIYTNTTEFNQPIDFGASWIHGDRNQPLMTLKEKGNIETHIDNEAIIMYSDGRRFTDDMQKTFEKTKEEIWAWVEDQDKNPASYPNLFINGNSIKELLELNKTTLTNNYSELNTIIYNDIWQESADNSGSDVATLDRRGFALGRNVEGEELIIVSGNIQLVNAVATPDTINKVQLNRPVKKIDYTSTQKVSVIDINDNKLDADYVVCTIPLGVLKQPGNNSLFNPPLSETKINSFKMVKAGLLTKFCMLFPYTFWSSESLIVLLPDNPTSYAYTPDNIDEAKMINDLLYYKSTIEDSVNIENNASRIWKNYEERWLNNLNNTQLNLINMSVVSKGQVNMLVATFPGSLGWIAERIDPAKLSNMIYRRLNKAFSMWWVNNMPDGSNLPPTIPIPIKTYCTKWSREPYSMQAYSYIGVGGTKQDVNNIKESLRDSNNNMRVVFAGEHTNVKYLATSTAAFSSGYNAANKIFKDNNLPELPIPTN